MRLLFITICLFSSLVHAQAIDIKKVSLECTGKNKCGTLRSSLKSLKRTYGNLDHFHRVLKLYVSNEGVEQLVYELEKSEGGYLLKMQGSQKRTVFKVQKIQFTGAETIELPSILPIREDEFVDYRKIEQTRTIIQGIGRDRGYPDTTVKINIKDSKEGLIIKPVVNLGRAIEISKINIISNSNLLSSYLKNMLGGFEKRVLDLQTIKNEIEESRKAFVQYGYYLADIDLRVKLIGKYKALLFVEVKNPYFYTFYFQSLTTFELNSLKLFLSETMLSYKREISEESMKQILTEYARDKGYARASVDVSKVKRKNTKGETGVYYSIQISAGTQAKIGDISFKGNSYFSNQDLRQLFYENGSSQAKSDVHDEKYYTQFLNVLRNKYISSGYVSVFLDEPLVNIDSVSNLVRVTYRLREGVRTRVRNISIGGVNRSEAKKIRELMTNKFEKPFNPIAFENDLEEINHYLQGLGYYYASISNKSGDGLVSYSSDLGAVDLNIDIFKGDKLFLNKVILIGNKVTRSRLIFRELNIDKGDLITVRKVEQAQTALLSLGIFNQVQIQPVRGGGTQTDLLVFVRERDFGTIEVAPGIRSDLGLKLSTVINYNNLDGLNKRITYRGSINRRLNLNSLEESRRDDQENFIEYDTSLDFAENNILRGDLDFRSSIGFSRQRFFTYDADIRRFSLGLSSQVNKWFSWLARYQLEAVSGYNSVPNEDGEDPNHAQFQIGSITPGVVLDFRDRSIGTRKGAIFDLSVEFANPAFYSQNTDDLKIDYYKLISRNKFYYSVSDNVVLALSTAFGYQENLATGTNSSGESVGYIPGIKVFRLSGADIIRGYEDDEMNRIDQTNDDISLFEVNSRAYMANLKFEPRYYYTDNIIMGLFYDAGRIFVDEFQGDNLKSSVGVTFKYLTPVGTLDIDYGIKLLRKEDSDGNLDSPGRLHVSIGFF